MRIRMTVAYDGSLFSGWQIQPHVRTVQEGLENALAALFGHPVVVTGAGRTDTGVHASGQVVHFDIESTAIPPEKIRLALARHLPAGILVLDSCAAAEEFHACFSARARTYRYRFVFPPLYPWQVHYRGLFTLPYDRERCRAALQPLVGRHDFTSFSLKDSSARTRIRELRRIDVLDRTGGFDLLFEADGFLRRMIRMITGTLLEALAAPDPGAHMAAVLAARDNARSGPPAPPGGLYLERVDYP